MTQSTDADVHGIVDGHLAGRLTVAHSYFDKGALGAACRVHGLAPIETRWLDSVRVAKRAWPNLQSHRLNILTKYLGIRHKHHDALSDARAAGQVIVRAIEHTGIELAGWVTPASGRVGPAPKPALLGLLKGQRIAVLGAPRDGSLAQQMAGAGARIVSSVGVTTTMLVISQDQPFGRYVTAHVDHRRAEQMQQSGGGIEIVHEQEICARLALPLVS